MRLRISKSKKIVKSIQFNSLSILRGSFLLILLFNFTWSSSSEASFCKEALKAMGEPVIIHDKTLNSDPIDLKTLFGTIIDTYDVVQEIKDEQNRALQLTRETLEIQNNITNLINDLRIRNVFLNKKKYFSYNEAQLFSHYDTKLKDLKLSIDHLKKSVPLLIEKTVLKVASFHQDMSGSLIKQMNDQLMDLVKNDPGSTKIIQLTNNIVSQTINSKNETILNRLKDIIDGLKVIENTVQYKLPKVLFFINQNREILNNWLTAYNDPFFHQFFEVHSADIVFEAYEMTLNDSLVYSYDAIESFIILQERIRK